MTINLKKIEKEFFEKLKYNKVQIQNIINNDRSQTIFVNFLIRHINQPFFEIKEFILDNGLLNILLNQMAKEKNNELLNNIFKLILLIIEKSKNQILDNIKETIKNKLPIIIQENNRTINYSQNSLKEIISIVGYNYHENNNSNEDIEMLDLSRNSSQKTDENIIEINNELQNDEIDIFSQNLILDNSKIYNSLIGLENLSETCYINSALQIIIHCKSFINKIRAIYIKSNIKDKSITNSFINLCNSLIDYENKEKKSYYGYTSSLDSICPYDFLINFFGKHKDYEIGQQDSIEFLRILLDDISKEINIKKNISPYKELTTKGKSKEEQCKEFHNFHKSRENSIIADIFYNQIISIFFCSCGCESYSFQKLLDIPLLLPSKKHKISVSLSTLINEYFKEEVSAWNSKCEVCKKPNLIHIKKTKCCILNKIVIFSLQRFDKVFSIKNDMIVIFDEKIDLKEYCDVDLYKENTKYRLFGTINHFGSINSGHYYSYIRIGEDWYKFNDSKVQKIFKMDYNNTSVCALFYEKI